MKEVNQERCDEKSEHGNVSQGVCPVRKIIIINSPPFLHLIA